MLWQRGGNCLKLNRFLMKNLQNVIPKRHSGKVSSAGMTFIQDDIPLETAKDVPMPIYGGIRFITLLTGESLMGRQGAQHITSLVDTAKVPIDFEVINLSEQKAKNLHEDKLSMLRNRIGIHIDLDVDQGSSKRRANLNHQFNLYACVSKFKSHPNFKGYHSDIDIWTFCQNNVGDYTKLEYEPISGMVESVRVTTAEVITRYLKYVFDYSLSHGRKKVTICHNVEKLPKADQMFMSIASSLKNSKYPNLELEFMITSEVAYNVVLCPHRFDVICSQSRYAHHITSILAGVCGGAGLFSSMDVGDDFVIIKPLETKLGISDSRSLSPYGVVKTCIELLHYMDKNECAKVMQKELDLLMDRDIRTKEFGGKYTSEYVICHIVNNLKDKFNCVR